MPSMSSKLFWSFGCTTWLYQSIVTEALETPTAKDWLTYHSPTPIMEPVRGVERRDRQGGRRSWWSKAENLNQAQQLELRDIVAAAEKEEEAKEAKRDAAPMRPQRRGTRRMSWWGKDGAGASHLNEVPDAADEEASEGGYVPECAQKIDSRRLSWWSSALVELKRVDADLSDLEKEEEAGSAEPAEDSSTQGKTLNSTEEVSEVTPPVLRRLPRRVASVCLSAEKRQDQRMKWWKKRVSQKGEQAS